MTTNNKGGGLAAWVAINRERLKLQFHREYGGQVQEWPDFAESEYAKSCAGNKPLKHPKNAGH